MGTKTTKEAKRAYRGSQGTVHQTRRHHLTMHFFKWCKSNQENNQYDYLNLETQLNTLNDDALYNVKEVMSNGIIVTHMTNLKRKEVAKYCKMIWLKDHPANFVFETVFRNYSNAI